MSHDGHSEQGKYYDLCLFETNAAWPIIDACLCLKMIEKKINVWMIGGTDGRQVIVGKKSIPNWLYESII